MVEEGFAVAFGAYQIEEAAARSARRGIWASEFERPQEWRRRHMPESP
jgi:endonuclease YncB( thermonuclease family)